MAATSIGNDHVMAKPGLRAFRAPQLPSPNIPVTRDEHHSDDCMAALNGG